MRLGSDFGPFEQFLAGVFTGMVILIGVVLIFSEVLTK